MLCVASSCGQGACGKCHALNASHPLHCIVDGIPAYSADGVTMQAQGGKARMTGAGGGRRWEGAAALRDRQALVPPLAPSPAAAIFVQKTGPKVTEN